MEKHIFTGLFALGVMTACSPSSERPNAPSNDPYRAEAMTACPMQRSYVNRDPDRVRKYCACVYDQTMKSLTEPEKMTARFYLLNQMGVDTRTREAFKTLDLTTAGTSSAAIGRAVKKCGRP